MYYYMVYFEGSTGTYMPIIQKILEISTPGIIQIEYSVLIVKIDLKTFSREFDFNGVKV